MAPDHASRDTNSVPTLLAVSNVDGISPVLLWADPTTHRLLVQLTSLASVLNTDSFIATNGQSVFNATSPNIAGTIYVAVNGLIDTPTTDYSVSGTTLTLSTGVPAGTQVTWEYFMSGTNPYQTDAFTATSNQTIFTASKTPLFVMYLTVNGQVQTKGTDYNMSGSVATLTNGVPAGSIVLWTYATS